MVQLNCKGGGYQVSPLTNNMTLICPHCEAAWHSKTSGIMWYAGDQTYNKLSPSFYPIVINFETIRKTLQAIKAMVTRRPSNDLQFFDDRITENNSEFTAVSRQLERQTGGQLSTLPSSSSLLVDYSGLPVCPDCYNSLLEILPF